MIGSRRRGDEFFAVFASAVNAVNCALAIQEAVGDDPELKLRIGVHLGETLLEGGKLYGDGVNVASRIRPLAEPGSVYASGEVYRAIRNQPGIEARWLGEKELKGVPDLDLVCIAPRSTPRTVLPSASPCSVSAFRQCLQGSDCRLERRTA